MVKFGRNHRGAMPVFSCKGFSEKLLLKMLIAISKKQEIRNKKRAASKEILFNRNHRTVTLNSNINQ